MVHTAVPDLIVYLPPPSSPFLLVVNLNSASSSVQPKPFLVLSLTSYSLFGVRFSSTWWPVYVDWKKEEEEEGIKVKIILHYILGCLTL